VAQGLREVTVTSSGSGDLASTIFNIINSALGIAALVALAYLIYGGFRFITAGDNDDAIGESKRIIYSALVGLIIMGISSALINYIVFALSSGFSSSI